MDIYCLNSVSPEEKHDRVLFVDFCIGELFFESLSDLLRSHGVVMFIHNSRISHLHDKNDHRSPMCQFNYILA